MNSKAFSKYFDLLSPRANAVTERNFVSR